MNGGYGVDTGADVFGVAAAITDSTAVFTIHPFSDQPKGKSGAYAMDSNGDAAAATYYGDKGGLGATAHEYSYELHLVAGSMDISDIAVGAKGSGKVMQTALVATSNDGWPVISVSGRDQVAASDTANMGSFSFPAATVNGRKKAQAIGFATGAGCKLQGCSVELASDDGSEMDSQGEEAAFDIANGIVTGSADFVEVTAAASWTLDTAFGASETKAPGQDKENTGYGTTNATFEKVITRA